MTRTITPEEVKKAYEKTGLIPTRGFFRLGNTACGLGALAVAEAGTTACGPDFEFAGWLKKSGLPTAYRRGFTTGFDGYEYPDRVMHFVVNNKKEQAQFKQGFDDGAAAWLVVQSFLTTEE